ncbi:NPP1 family protein [Streptosporangium roseum]|uniref:NPP1 family protein n=1 Tax=Streptosporangium roseum TaxID=2001 RepID=UPI000A887D5B|nr:NPP1 family protein [Streptosporangium roseum]
MTCADRLILGLRPRSEGGCRPGALRPSGTHPKIVYHKDGGSTHAFRSANAADDALENHAGGWFYPRLIAWNGYLGISNGDVRFRNTFVYHSNFGEARLEIDTASMEAQLERAKPGGIPFDPKGPWPW